ncbi:MAG: VOC family protein [Actinomycetota bacterium]
MAEHVELDHLAVTAESTWELWQRYGAELGGRLVGGGPTSGFHWSQVRFGGGMKIEMLEPRDVEEFDFLRRFLDRHGPGPHHLTFKVPHLATSIEEVEAAGATVVGVDLDSETWKEAFLHPASACGIVVQIAQEGGDDDPELTEVAPAPRHGATAHLDRIVHLVPDLGAALALFAGPLRGEAAAEGDDGGRWVELRWPGPGRLRLLEPVDGELRAWLGDRPGRLHHVAFTHPDPQRIDGAKPVEDAWEIAPGDHHGVRIRLRSG